MPYFCLLYSLINSERDLNRINLRNLLLEVASNFSDFFFFFHFQGLKSLPSICIRVFLCAGGVAEHTEAAEPTLKYE